MTGRETVSAAVVLGITLASGLAAVDGVPDRTFSIDGRVTENFGSPSSTATAIAAFPDGSLLVGGSAVVGTVTSDENFAVVRYRSNGEVDTSWGDNGRRLVPINWTPSAEDKILEIVLDDTGRAILLGSTRDPYWGVSLPALARLTPQGDLDPEFGDGGRIVAPGGTYGYQTYRAIAHRGGFLFHGSFCCWGPLADVGQFFYRTDADGQPDPTFGVDGWIQRDESAVGPIGARPDGRFLVAEGTLSNRFVLHGYLANGSPDPAFGSNGRATIELGDSNWAPSSIAFAEDGWIYVGLQSYSFSSQPMSGSVARVSASGELDEAFGFPDLTLEEGSKIVALAVTSDNKIVAAGPIDANGSQTGGFLVARLLPTGEFDASFDGNGVNRIEFDLLANADDSPLALVLSGGKPVIAGFASFAHASTAFATLRLENRHVFGGTFEVGDLSAWSGWVGYQP